MAVKGRRKCTNPVRWMRFELTADNSPLFNPSKHREDFYTQWLVEQPKICPKGKSSYLFSAMVNGEPRLMMSTRTEGSDVVEVESFEPKELDIIPIKL